MKPFVFLIAAALACPVLYVNAQDKSPIKFGKITPEDFTLKQAYDTGASAVVIADIGSSVLRRKPKRMVFTGLQAYQPESKSLNKNGFDAAKEADITFTPVQNGGAEEKLDDLKAITYNLENGKVVETKLEAASVFKDKLDKNHFIKKFTMPAVKEGSVIEYSYTLKSDFIENLQPWYFQSEYPCLYSSYEVGIPEFFNYVTIGQGYLQPEIKTDSYRSNFRIMIPGGADHDENLSMEGAVNTRKWIVRNIPALRTESYTSSIKNYIGGVEFQLSSYQFRGGIAHDQMGNWTLLGQKLMENEYFGGTLSKNNNWLDDDLKTITKGATTKLEKAHRIFAYVRDNHYLHRSFVQDISKQH